MIVTFLANAAPFPIGGAIAVFELANGLIRRGHDVTVVHLDFAGRHVESLSDVGWFRFEEAVNHRFLATFDDRDVPTADFVVTFDDRIPRQRGLPVSLLTARGALPGLIEAVVLTEPYPKLCISRALIDRFSACGVPKEKLFYLPLGIDHDTFFSHTPLEGRPLRVAMRFNTHPQKGMHWGLPALEQVRKAVPGVEVMLYGEASETVPIPRDFTMIRSPDQDTLVRDVYNESRVFVCSSTSEGFGMPSAEAMACGCALVTTDNGGSREFAVHEETALVCPPSDVDALARQVVTLLRNDDHRIALARNGMAMIQQFRWNRSAAILEEFLNAYGADPDHFQASTAPRLQITPDLEELVAQRDRLSARHILGAMDRDEYLAQTARLTELINAMLPGNFTLDG